MTDIVPFVRIVFVLLVMTVPFYFLVLNKIIGVLKNKYPQKYIELGKPSLFFNNSPENGMNLLGFVFSKDGINDADLNNYKLIAKIFLIGDFAVFIPLFIYIVLHSFLRII